MRGGTKPNAVAWAALDSAWRVAFEEAWRAYCAGSNPSGAAVFTRDFKLVARERNRTREVDAVAGVLVGVRLAHAELNALALLTDEAVDPAECILYATTEPCPLCLGALVMSNVRELRFARRDPWAGAVALLDSTDYIRRQNIMTVGPTSDPLEHVLTIMAVDFALRDGSGRGEPLVDGFKSTDAVGVAVALRLLAKPELHRLRARRPPAAEGWAFLVDALRAGDRHDH